MSEHTAENDERQWSVRAENGTTCFASEEVAIAAVTEGGYTLGPERSPIVAAFTRDSAADEWTRFIPPGEHGCCASCGHLTSIHTPGCEACDCPRVFPPATTEDER